MIKSVVSPGRNSDRCPNRFNDPAIQPLGFAGSPEQEVSLIDSVNLDVCWDVEIDGG